MSLAKKAISGALWMSGISYLGFAINFGIQLVLVRLLVPEDFGLFALGLSIAEILFIFFSFSFSMAAIQIHEAEDLFDTAFYLSLLSGFVILVIGGIISLLISSYYPLPTVIAFLILCALQPLQGCSSIYSASMEKELQFKKNAVVRGIATNFSGFGAIFLAYMGFGVWSLVSREIITALLMFVGMRFFARYRFGKKFNRETAKKLFEFGYKMLLSRGLEILYHRVPNFFIGTFAGTKALGLFSQTYYLANLPNTILGPAHQNVAYATYSKIQEDKEKMSKAFYITNYFFIRLMFPIMLILFLYPTEVLRILYGNKWLEASSMLKYFAIYAAFLPLFSNAKSFAYGLGRLLDVSKAYLIEILFLSIGMFVALYTGKIYLGALAYSLSLFFGLFTAFYFLKRESIKLHLKELFLIPILVSFVVILLWPSSLNLLGIPSLPDKIYSLVFVLVISMVFMIVILFCEPKRTMENLRYIQKRLI
jgi:O-antigen/teichoic acid export membrane protein